MTKEEAIKRIKDWNLDNDKMEVLSAIIPELKESEDERILRELLNYHKAAAEGKVEILPDIRHDVIVAWLEKHPVEWSEEDEIMLKNIFASLNNYAEKSHPCLKNVVKDEINWLKSLKDRVQPQPKQELREDAATTEYIDLGLPSGTLWKLFNEDGYYTFDEAVEKFNNQLPTKDQWNELKDNCNWAWNGAGYEVTGPNGNTIFLPANGYRYGNGAGLLNVGTYGYYWSSTYHNEAGSYYMGLSDVGINVNNGSRFCGQSVRLVK